MKAMLFIVKLGVTIIGHFILAVTIGAALLFTLGSGLIDGDWRRAQWASAMGHLRDYYAHLADFWAYGL
jgi:hypothetical protein